MTWNTRRKNWARRSLAKVRFAMCVSQKMLVRPERILFSLFGDCIIIARFYVCRCCRWLGKRNGNREFPLKRRRIGGQPKNCSLSSARKTEYKKTQSGKQRLLRMGRRFLHWLRFKIRLFSNLNFSLRHSLGSNGDGFYLKAYFWYEISFPEYIMKRRLFYWMKSRLHMRVLFVVQERK